MTTATARNPKINRSRYDIVRLLSNHRWSFVANTADDWKCACGWFGSHGWMGWAHHIAAESALLDELGEQR